MDAILTTILTIIAMIFLGFILKKTGTVDEKVVPSLNSIVLNLFLPCMMFTGLYSADLSNLNQMIVLPFVIILVGLILVTIFYFVLKRHNLDDKKIWAILVALMICNTGFMGYPVNLGVFGAPGFIRAIFCDMSASISFLVLSFILILLYGGTIKTAIKKILTIMPLYALIFGVIFNLCSIPIPPLILNILNYLAAGTVPLIMISLGMSINLDGLFRNKSVVVGTTVVKLLIFPLLVFILGVLLGITGLEFQVMVTQAAMPSGMMSLILAINNKLDHHLTSDIIFTNTLLSLVTLPMILYLL